MPQGKGYKDYDSAGKKKSIAKRLGKAAIEVATDPTMGYSKMMNAPKAPPRAKAKPQSKRRPGEAPSTIAGRTARTAPVKKSAKGTSAASKKRLPRQATSGGGSGLAGRSPAMSPKKKGDAGRRAADRAAERAKSDARRTRSGDMDRSRRSKDTDKAALKKRLRTKSGGRMAQQSNRKRDEATSRNRRYKDDRAYRD